MSIRIDKKNYSQLIKGASIFTTGGGIPIDDQMRSLKKLDNLKTELISLSEFNKNAYICTVAELGPTDTPPLKKDKVIKKMLELLTKVTGRNISGLYPPEIGQESVVLESAHFLKLPIADFDPVGFRAVPFLGIDIFNLKGTKSFYTPMAVSTDQEEIFLIEGNISYERLENILRGLTQFSKSGVVILLGGVVSINQLLELGVRGGSYLQAIGFGKESNKESILQKLQPRMVIEAKVIRKVRVEEKGFLAEVILIRDKDNKKYKLVVLNEVIFLLDENNKIISAVPDRILLFDSDNLCGISGANISNGMSLTILIIDCLEEWKTAEGEKIFGRKRFEFLLKKLPTL